MNAFPGPQLIDVMLRSIFKYCDITIKYNVTATIFTSVNRFITRTSNRKKKQNNQIKDSFLLIRVYSVII